MMKIMANRAWQILFVLAISMIFGLQLFGCTSPAKVVKSRRILAPFPSSIEGVSIPNAHIVARKKGFIARGMLPYEPSEVKALQAIGVTDVLIFRSDTSNEAGVAEEYQLLKEQGFKDSRIHHIPFAWKEVKSFEASCEQTLNALKLLVESLEDSKRGLYFHCTVGEDRTGYLAGLYRVLIEGADEAEVFKNEMCARGYAEGDPTKPHWISEKVHQNITFQYLQMIDLLKNKKHDYRSLDLAVCQTSPGAAEMRAAKAQSMLKNFRCVL